MVILLDLGNQAFSYIINMSIKNSNNFLSSFIAKLNMGSIRRLRYIKVDYSKITIEIVNLLYVEGIIRLFMIRRNTIFIYFKYRKGLTLFRFKMLSIPSNRIYWSMRKLTLDYNRNNFSGFYVISSSRGLITSNNALLFSPYSGEVLFKVYI